METPLDALLERSAWTRALAKRLVADAHEADDLVQQTWLAAIERPPARGVPITRWIAAVMRNLARQHRREDSRRTQREHVAARAEVDLSHDGLAERLETHRALVAAVAALSATSRSAILMRYFEGLSPREIARRTRTPVRTVHTRLHRALHELREKLDHEHGDSREAWLLALAPLTHVPNPAAAWMGVAIVDAKLKVACAALVVVGAATYFALRPDVSVSPQPRAAELEAASLDALPPEPSSDALPSNRMEVAQPSAASSATPTAPAPVESLVALRGRVLDTNASPVAGVLVQCREYSGGPLHDALAPSAADGRFQIQPAPRSGTLETSSEHFTIVFSPYVYDSKDDFEYLLVVAPRVQLAGRVVDAEGHALAGAQICIQFRDNLRSHFATELPTSTAVDWRATSSERGEFAFDTAPAIEGAIAIATLAGYERTELDLPLGDRFDLVLTMQLDADRASILRGTVVDADGAALPDAWVALGYHTVRSNAAGIFAMPLASAADATSVFAVHVGLMAVRIERQGTSGAVREAWPDPFVIHLDSPALAIKGRVVDADGALVADAMVWSEDNTQFGAIEEHGSEGSFSYAVNAETLARGEKHALHSRTTADGRFELRGLLQKSYALCVARDSTLDFVCTQPIAAGATDVEVRLPRSEHIARIAGRVVGKSGTPLAQARVDMRAMIDLPAREGRAAQTIELPGMATTTDAEGRFEFHDVPRRARRICVSSNDIAMGNVFEIADAADLEHLEFVVALACRVQIDLLEHADDATWAQLLDSDGKELACLVMHGNTSISCNSVVLSAGRSEVFTVSEEARTFVLMHYNSELSRREIHLTPGDVNVLH